MIAPTQIQKIGLEKAVSQNYPILKSHSAVSEVADSLQDNNNSMTTISTTIQGSILSLTHISTNTCEQAERNLSSES